MNTAPKQELLLEDLVAKLSMNTVSGVAASIINAFILDAILWRTMERSLLLIWTGCVVLIGLLRFCLHKRYMALPKNNRFIRRSSWYFIFTIALSGAAWGVVAFFPIPGELIVYQVFIALVIGGMVAGSVGVYSVMWRAFFAFSIPAAVPIILRSFLVGGALQYGIGSMMTIFWCIMLVTAVKLNRDIIGYLMTKYENLDLISDLEAEVKSREAAESDLKRRNAEIEGIIGQRTSELLEANRKLIQEIEERRTIAAALQENEEKYRDLVENINDVIFSADENGILTYISPVVRSMLGYTPREIVGKDLKEFVHKQDLPLIETLLQKRREGSTEPVDYRFRTKTDGYRWIRSSSRGVFREGRFAGVSGAWVDISEKMKLEAQLRLSLKMEAIATLTGGIAHDFNNLLAVILGNSELALLDLPEEHDTRGYMEKIIVTTLKAKGIVKELLSFSSQTGSDRKLTNISMVIREELERIKLSASPAIRVVDVIAPDTDPVMGDPMQINQVLTNLCSNAIDAMSEAGGTLEIGVENCFLSPDDIQFDSDLSPGRYVRMRVKDTGIGIAAQNIGRLFDPYYTTKGVGKGDGLGLAVVHGIVKRHGGGIRVISELGEGACFDAFFPVIETLSRNSP